MSELSEADWSLISLLSSAIEQCRSIEFFPLTSTDEYIVYCHCEENLYLCLNVFQIKPIIHLCYSFLFSKNHQQPFQLNIITRVLLCYVTECLTSWNIRRHLIQSNEIEIQQELQLVETLHYLKPKSEQLFRYRRWLIKQENVDKISSEKELEICTRTAEKHFINYASWLHRRWVIDYFSINLDEELERNRSWLERNITDSSGFSFRMYLLSKKPLNEKLIEQELKLDETLLKFYHDKESLWIYRQMLIFAAIKLVSVDKEKLITNEFEVLTTVAQNLFSNKYSQLLRTILSSDGKLFRN